jgi:putative membrane protein
MPTADRFFSEDERRRIVAATRQAEARTSGELVVLVAETSGRHRDVEVASALIVSVVASALVTVFVPQVSWWYWIALSAAIFPLSLLFFARAQAVTLSVVPPRRIEDSVRAGALRAFHEHGLNQTKGQTGVLFYIALAERTVFVLADKGIHEKITQQELDRHAREIAAGMKAGRACEALLQAIAGIGEVLAAHFPRSADDVNELADDALNESGE